MTGTYAAPHKAPDGRACIAVNPMTRAQIINPKIIDQIIIINNICGRRSKSKFAMLAAAIALLYLWQDTKDYRERWELGRARLPLDMNTVSYTESPPAAVFGLPCKFRTSRELSTGSVPSTDILMKRVRPKHHTARFASRVVPGLGLACVLASFAFIWLTSSPSRRGRASGRGSI